MAARCHRSWKSVSATATLNLPRRRSLRLLTVWRLSLSECESSSLNSSVRTPTQGIGAAALGHRLRSHPFAPEGFNHVARLDVVEVLNRDPAFEAALHFACVILEALQSLDFPGV